MAQATDLQSQLDRINRRRKLAEAMAGNAMRPIDPNRSSGRYVTPISPFEGLAQVLQGGLAARSMNNLDKEETGARKTANENFARALMGSLTKQPVATTPAPAQQPQGATVLPSAAAAAEGDLLASQVRQPAQNPPLDPIEVSANRMPKPPQIQTMDDFLRQVAESASANGVSIADVLANPAIAAKMKQLEELSKPQKLGEGEKVFAPGVGVIAEGDPKLTEFQRNLQGLNNPGYNPAQLETYKAHMGKDTQPQNVVVDPNTGKAYGMVFNGQQWERQELPGAQQTPQLPDGMTIGPDGKPMVDPLYLDMKKQVAAAGADNLQLFAPQPGLDAQGNSVFFQPNKGGGAPSIVPGVTPKPPEGYNKQKAGVDSVVDAMRQYKDILTTSGGRLDRLTPKKRLEIGTMYNNMMLQAKEAYNLGVLNGPDYSILQEVIKNPLDLESQIYSAEDLKKQVDAFNQVMMNVGKSIDASYGRDKGKSPAFKRYNPATGKIE